MEVFSRQQLCGSMERAVECRTIKWLMLTSFIQIWMLLLVTPVISESIKFLRKEDKDGIAFGFQGKSEVNSLRQRRFIVFDRKAGNVDIDLELKIPFLSIPLENNNNKTGLPIPQVKLNYKSLIFFGTLMALITFVIPVLFTELPNHQSSNFYGYLPNFAKEHKRSDRGLSLTSYFGDSLNEILNETNGKLQPCIERLVCSAVATAKHADQPTSFDVIIDTLSSHSLFKNAVNGTAIKDAVTTGQQVLSAEDCVTTSSECAFDQKILLNILKMIGL